MRQSKIAEPHIVMFRFKPKPCSSIAVAKMKRRESPYIVKITTICQSKVLFSVQKTYAILSLALWTNLELLVFFLLSNMVRYRPEICGQTSLLKQTASTDIVNIERIVEMTIPTLGISAGT